MNVISRSLAPAVRKATRLSTDVSKCVFDCLILAMMMSSESFACSSRITSRLVIATGPVLLGAAFFAGAGCALVVWGNSRTVNNSMTIMQVRIQMQRLMKSSK